MVDVAFFAARAGGGLHTGGGLHAGGAAGPLGCMDNGFGGACAVTDSAGASDLPGDGLRSLRTALSTF